MSRPKIQPNKISKGMMVHRVGALQMALVELEKRVLALEQELDSPSIDHDLDVLKQAVAAKPEY